MSEEKTEIYPCDTCIYQNRTEMIFQDACDRCHPNGYPYHTPHIEESEDDKE